MSAKVKLSTVKELTSLDIRIICIYTGIHQNFLGTVTNINKVKRRTHVDLAGVFSGGLVSSFCRGDQSQRNRPPTSGHTLDKLEGQSPEHTDLPAFSARSIKLKADNYHTNVLF